MEKNEGWGNVKITINGRVIGCIKNIEYTEKIGETELTLLTPRLYVGKNGKLFEHFTEQNPE